MGGVMSGGGGGSGNPMFSAENYSRGGKAYDKIKFRFLLNVDDSIGSTSGRGSSGNSENRRRSNVAASSVSGGSLDGDSGSGGGRGTESPHCQSTSTLVFII